MRTRAGMSRRQFLVRSTGAAAAVGLGLLPGGRASRASARPLGANDRIVLGVIGTGGQGIHDINMCLQRDQVVCAAMCDVAGFRMDFGARVFTATMKSQGFEGVDIAHFDDHRRLLDRKDIDAVVIATPDHWHAGPFIDACEAGKHIYQEKPFSFSIELGQRMLEAAEKHPELCIQIGTQRRSHSNHLQAKAYIEAGKLGTVHFVRAFDCRNYISGEDPFTPEATGNRFGGNIDWRTVKVDWDRFQEPCSHKVPFDALRYTAWRWYWDYAGGLVTDVGVHVIDNVHWLLGEPVPVSAVCNGGVYGVKYWETPDVVNATIDYGRFSLVFTGNFTNGFEGDGYILYGTKGTLECRGNDIKVWAEGDRSRPLEHWPDEGVAHQHNWIDAMRGQARLNAPVQLGVSSLLPSHLANLAYRSGRRITWDPAAKKAT